MSRNETTALISVVFGAVGVIGFLASLGWSKAIGKEIDRDKIIFLTKLWGGFVIVFVLLDLIR